MPVLVSSNWANWIISAAAFGVTEFLLFKNTPKAERSTRAWKNILIGLVVTACVQLVLFTWSTIQTVYDDHHDSTGRWHAVVNEKNSLKGSLQERDSYIGRLEAAISTKPGVIEKVKFTDQPKKCWYDLISKNPPNPQTKHAVSVVTIHCNYRVDAPLRISLETNSPIANFNWFLPGVEGLPISVTNPVSGTEKGMGVDRSLYIDIQGPSLAAEQMVVIPVEGTTTSAPIPLKASIRSK